MNPTVYAIVQFEKQLADNTDMDKVGRIKVNREAKEEMHALDGNQGAYFIMVGAFENDEQAQRARIRIKEMMK